MTNTYFIPHSPTHTSFLMMPCFPVCQFIEKRRELKQEGRTDPELVESYCFLFPDKSKVSLRACLLHQGVWYSAVI